MTPARSRAASLSGRSVKLCRTLTFSGYARPEWRGAKTRAHSPILPPGLADRSREGKAMGLSDDISKLDRLRDQHAEAAGIVHDLCAQHGISGDALAGIIPLVREGR